MIGLPAVTGPSSRGWTEAKSSVLVTMTKTVSCFPAAATLALEKVTMGSPAVTRASCWTWQVRPSPAISTVSTPTCTSTSEPSSARMPTACGMAESTVPETGEKTVSSAGLTATPAPIAPEENTGSAVSESWTTEPVTGEQTVPRSYSVWTGASSGAPSSASGR